MAGSEYRFISRNYAEKGVLQAAPPGVSGPNFILPAGAAALQPDAAVKIISASATALDPNSSGFITVTGIKLVVFALSAAAAAAPLVIAPGIPASEAIGPAAGASAVLARPGFKFFSHDAKELLAAPVTKWEVAYYFDLVNSDAAAHNAQLFAYVVWENWQRIGGPK